MKHKLQTVVQTPFISNKKIKCFERQKSIKGSEFYLFS